MARMKEEKVQLTETEVKNMRAFFETELHLRLVVFSGLFVVSAAILATAQLEFTDDSKFIYVLYFGLLVSLVFLAWTVFGIVSIALARRALQKEKFRIFKTKNYKVCMNKTRRELRGKRYYVVHVLWCRYAIRIQECDV